MSNSLIDQISSVRDAHIDAALCLVVSTEGSTPLKAGASMVVRADGTIDGTVGGGALEKSVIDQALMAIESGTPGLTEHRLVRDHQMCCGGTVHVFVQPLPVRERLYVFGAGHVAAAVAAACAPLEFDVTVIDDRPRIFDAWPDRDREVHLNLHPRDAVPGLPWDARTYAVIATYDHPLDRETLALCLKRPHAYCGMIGSRRKIALTRALFLEQGWATADELDRVDMPIGADIGAQSPAEIAVSIAASLVTARRRRLSARRSNQPSAAVSIEDCLQSQRQAAIGSGPSD